MSLLVIICFQLLACQLFWRIEMAVAVIVHPSNTSDFDQSIIKKMYLGKKKVFSNGRTAILLAAGESDPVMTEFNEKVMEKANSQIKAYWSKIIFTGKGEPPQEMNSASEVISSVSTNPDCMGYIDSSAVTDAVKVIATF